MKKLKKFKKRLVKILAAIMACSGRLWAKINTQLDRFKKVPDYYRRGHLIINFNQVTDTVLLPEARDGKKIIHPRLSVGHAGGARSLCYGQEIDIFLDAYLLWKARGKR